jgi:hypothetical protein
MPADAFTMQALYAELGEYHNCLVDRGLGANTIITYMDRANRFLTFVKERHEAK